ncbi:MAG: Asp23/Gls24 family envelope stress response protein [Chloroflexota bacterium]|nr:Asp23/Gls24 family envelope stress response protein [Chloroflexota bacterium]
MGINEAVPGKIVVEPEVLKTIARLTTQKVAGVAQIYQKVEGERFLGLGRNPVEVCVNEGRVSVEVHVLADHEVSLLRLGKTIQKEVTQAIQRMIEMPVDVVNVYIEDVISEPLPVAESA